MQKRKLRGKKWNK